MAAEEVRERGASLEAELLDATQLEAIIAAQEEEEDAAQLAAALEMSVLDSAGFADEAVLADAYEEAHPPLSGDDVAHVDDNTYIDAASDSGLVLHETSEEAYGARTPVGGSAAVAVNPAARRIPSSATAASGLLATAALFAPGFEDGRAGGSGITHAIASSDVETRAGHSRAAVGIGAGFPATVEPFAHVTPAPRFGASVLPDWARTVPTVGAAAAAGAAATVATVRADVRDRASTGSTSSSFPDISPPMSSAAAAGAAGPAAGRAAGTRLRSLLEDADSKSYSDDDDVDDGDDGARQHLHAVPRRLLSTADSHAYAAARAREAVAGGPAGPVTPVGHPAGGSAAASAPAAASGELHDDEHLVDDSNDDHDDDDGDDDDLMDADALDGDAEAGAGDAAGDQAETADAGAAAGEAQAAGAGEGEAGAAAEGEGQGEGEGDAPPPKPLGFYITSSIPEADGVPFTGLVEGEDAVALEVDIPPQEPLRSLLGEAIVCVTSARAGCSIPELLDPDTSRCFWQSDGAAPHAITLQFYRRVSLAEVALYLDFAADESYCPLEIHIKSGNSVAELSEMRRITLTEPVGWVRLPFIDAEKRGLRRYLRTQVLQLVITANHSNGRDCHVRGLHAFGPWADPRLAAAAQRGWGFAAAAGSIGPTAAAADGVDGEAAALAADGGVAGAGLAGPAATAGAFGSAAAPLADSGFSFGLFDSIR